LELKFDGFEGTLETLYQLVKKSIVDIKRVSLLYIARQLLEYSRAPRVDINRAAHYLYLLSLLISIKLAFLIPSQDFKPEEEPPPQEKGMPPWVEKWRERLEELHRRRWRVFHHRREGVPAREEVVGDLEEFTEAYFSILRREAARRELEKTVGRRDFSEFMERVREEIESKGKLSLGNLVSICRDGEEAIFAFFLLLEMLRQGDIIAIQEIPFSEIFIWSREAFENEIAKT